MIGQKKLKLFIKNISSIERIPTEINILLTGKAGMGKTHGLEYIYRSLSKNGVRRDCVEHHPEFVNLDFLKSWEHTPIHIIDEIHMSENFEQFYDFMENHLFLTATNLPEDLPEAFRTRCINLVLEKYSKKELGKIVYERYDFPEKIIKDLVMRSRGSPRDILQMASIININQEADLEELGYFKDGFRSEDFIYLDYMKKVKTSSLGRIVAGTNLDKTIVEETIEPFLLEKGIISITNRRNLNEASL